MQPPSLYTNEHRKSMKVPYSGMQPLWYRSLQALQDKSEHNHLKKENRKENVASNIILEIQRSYFKFGCWIWRTLRKKNLRIQSNKITAELEEIQHRNELCKIRIIMIMGNALTNKGNMLLGVIQGHFLQHPVCESVHFRNSIILVQTSIFSWNEM